MIGSKWTNRDLLPFMKDFPEVKPYLEYLDKEMTIMGILSTFCAVGSAVVTTGSFRRKQRTKS
jgi:hypothetical protein